MSNAYDDAVRACLVFREEWQAKNIDVPEYELLIRPDRMDDLLADERVSKPGPCDPVALTFMDARIVVDECAPQSHICRMATVRQR